MTVFVLIREDQDGFIDTSIAGVFREAAVAKGTLRENDVVVSLRCRLAAAITSLITTSATTGGRISERRAHFAQPSSFSVGQRLAQGTFSLQPRPFRGPLLFRQLSHGSRSSASLCQSSAA